MSRLRAKLAGCGLSVAALLVPLHAAQAYVRTRAESTQVELLWPEPCIRVELLMGSLPNGVDETLFRTAANEAAAAWSSSRVACTKMFMSVGSSIASSRYIADDRNNTVQFRKDYWGRNARKADERVPYPAQALAITSVYANPKTGVIVDTDVELNATGPLWGDLVANPQLARSSNFHDLQNTLTHEFGHVVGLDHTCDGGGQSNPTDHSGQRVQPCPGPLAVQETTMAAIVMPGDTLRRSLAADEEQAMCDLYAADGTLACSGKGDGGCSIGDRSSRATDSAAWAACVIAALGFSWFRRRQPR